MLIDYYADTDLEALNISPVQIREAIEDVLRGQAAGKVSVAPKTTVIAPDKRYMMATLAASDAAGVIAIKSVMVNDRNKAAGLPGINGAIMLLDAETGILKAVMDANWVTAVRTAGLSAVAAKRLANPDARVLGLIGAGVQAESHMRAFCAEYPLEEVRVFGRSAAGIEATSTVARDLGLTVSVADTPQACVDGADLIVSSVTLDYTIEPFLDVAWLKPGAFASITDLGIPWHKNAMSLFDAIYVDDAVQERAMERPMVDPALIRGDLQDLVIKGHARSTDSPQAFVFRGMAAGDLAIAALAYKKASSLP